MITIINIICKNYVSKTLLLAKMGMKFFSATNQAFEPSANTLLDGGLKASGTNLMCSYRILRLFGCVS